MIKSSDAGDTMENGLVLVAVVTSATLVTVVVTVTMVTFSRRGDRRYGDSQTDRRYGYSQRGRSNYGCGYSRKNMVAMTTTRRFYSAVKVVLQHLLRRSALL